jgi:uncharacterized membrane protein YqjE
MSFPNTNANGKVKRSLVGGVGEIIGDFVTLAELQFQLLVVDSRESARKLVLPAIVATIGLLLLAGCFPVLLMFIGIMLYDLAGLSASLSAGIALLIGFVLAVTLTWLGLAGLKKAFNYFERSVSELKKNVEWLKQLKESANTEPQFTRPPHV